MVATPPTTRDILQWALFYERRGWSVIPVDPKTKEPCLKWGQYQTERPTENNLRKWFADKHKALAVVLGAVSGNLGALDLDNDERGKWWTRTHAELARTLPTEETKRGIHVLFRCDPVGTQRKHKAKVELLSKGAYVILTPSPGKRWLIPPNGEIPQIDPFSLGLETFGIQKPQFDKSKFTQEGFTQDNQEMACVSCVSCGNPKLDSRDLEARIDAVIAKTLPQDTGERNANVFTFCQWLKGIVELRGCPAAELKHIVRQWHRAAYSVIGTKAFDTTWEDFVYGWKRVKWPKGIVLGRAVQTAREDTENPPEAQDYEDSRTRLLVRVCWQLQRVHGGEPFYLSLRTAGEILDVSHTAAAKKLEMLMADGLLAIASAHTRRLATCYRYINQHEANNESK